jgi:methionyl aminopeptidase
MGAMTDHTLECLREAGRIASAARSFGAAQVRPGASLREVCVAVEDDIHRRGGKLAFPVQSSRNHIAAHYCASPDDPTLYREGDLAKLDLGVHVDGWVVDTALTVNVGAVAAHQPLVDAAEEALRAAIATAGAGVPVRRLSGEIERAIRERGLQPVRNLCGHGVGRYVVHCPPPIPNIAGSSTETLRDGSVVAIEPFATNGPGYVAEEGTAQVFRLDPSVAGEGSPHPEVVIAIHALGGLPFARRQLGAFAPAAVEATLAWLKRYGRLTAYAPLVEKSGRPVAQAEHTIYVSAEQVEVLTR